MNTNHKTNELNTAQISNQMLDQANNGAGHIQPHTNPVAHALAMPTILHELSKNMGEFEKNVRSQLSARLGKKAANDGAGAEGADRSGLSAGMGTGGFAPYAVSPGEEMPNVLGELAEPGSVFRMNTLLSASFPLGPVGPYTNHHGQICQRREGSVSIALLGSGDQTLVLPTPSEQTEIAQAASPRVRWIRAAKTRVPGVPGDALLVTGIDQPRSGRGSGPWMLDHLGLSDGITADLHHAILSLKPAHQAFVMSAIARADIEQALVSLLPEVRARSVVHPLALGVAAAEQVNSSELTRDEVSLVRLACLIAELGSLHTAPDLVSGSGYSSSEALAREREAERAAHPLTQLTLRGLLTRFINLEPMSAEADGQGGMKQAVNDGVWLQLLLSDAVHQQYRIGSKYGPLGKNPVNPRFALMAQTFCDAMQLARREAYARLRDARPDPQQPLPLEPVPTLVTAALARVPGDSAEVGAGATKAGRESVGEVDDRAQGNLDLAYEPDEGPLTEMPQIDDSEDDDVSPLLMSLMAFPHEPVQLDETRQVRWPTSRRDSGRGAGPDAEPGLRTYADRKLPWPTPNRAWAAGMLDGDGCISIVKQRYPNRSATYRLVVQITQNCLKTLEHFRECVGEIGPIHEVTRRISHNKQVYALMYSGPGAVRVVQRLAPHLVRKRAEAEVALSFIENGQVGRRFGARGVPVEIERIRISHYNKLRALK
ncbi:hypothetical protein [Hydrogenophaga crocea]|jgi:hypothetical protein|uniref:Homing endonuclease LAGLIDADG domain-containing protein n=1 Tax=Hydrogenophaga crocea TaxID=2716225 RepID=A0A6G8IJE8_9BURK|nr:hypothetical protein [Hydrogenophaga crocea]QIM53203.1 hypothetical protein G9Q37_14100 [Hydrogenophaga crocea]